MSVTAAGDGLAADTGAPEVAMLLPAVQAAREVRKDPAAQAVDDVRAGETATPSESDFIRIDVSAPAAAQTGGVVLQGDQCLVFYLG